MRMAKKIRADELLVRQNMATSTDQAARLIMAGQVYTIQEELIRTAGEQLPCETRLYVKEKEHPYVSRGGIKLAHALTYFDIQLDRAIVLDIGSSTGGFTDVSLRAGAEKVYALDVGTNQLAWKLRNNERVIVMEQTNFRYAKRDDFKSGQPTFACTDVSFISLELIFPPLQDILSEGAQVIALIKPQFEADSEQIPDGGVIKDQQVYRSVLKKVIHSAGVYQFELQDLTISPITGSKGNHEFLAYFKKVVTPLDMKASNDLDLDRKIEKALEQIPVK